MKLLAAMHELAGTRLQSLPHEWKVLPQHLVEITRTKPANSAPPNMLKIPEADFEFHSTGIMIEGGNDAGVDVQYPWEDAPRRYHQFKLHIGSFYIDKYPVTNADFKKFMDSTHYHPRDDHNFLRDWKNGSYPEGSGNKPVTWVSLEDARAYAAWAGKRLPHEWEWQYAAQGTDGRTYPWGNSWNASAVPTPDKGREMGSPAEVDAHPLGASPFGVMDLVGNVWQWTDEVVDEHTRNAILKEAIIISLRVHYGISRRPTSSTSMASICSWPRAKIAPARWACAALSMRSEGLGCRARRKANGL